MNKALLSYSGSINICSLNSPHFLRAFSATDPCRYRVGTGINEWKINVQGHEFKVKSPEINSIPFVAMVMIVVRNVL